PGSGAAGRCLRDVRAEPRLDSDCYGIADDRKRSTTSAHLNVAITGYLLSLTVFIPISGWTADRFGHGGRSAWRSSSSHGFDWLRHGQFARRLGRRPDRVGIGGGRVLEGGWGVGALFSR